MILGFKNLQTIELGNMSFYLAEQLKLERWNLLDDLTLDLSSLRSLRLGYGTLFFVKEMVLSDLPQLNSFLMDTTSLYRCKSVQLFSKIGNT